MIGEGLLGADTRPYFWGAWDRLRFAFASQADEGEYDEGTLSATGGYWSGLTKQ